MSKRDYYDVLGVTKDSSAEDIKRAYRKKAMELHPDRNKASDAESKFKEAAEAYEILSSPEKKQKYDQFGHQAFSGGGGAGGGMNMDDIFSHFGDIFGDSFGGAFGGFGGGGRGGAVRGSNLRVRVKLTLEEISTGVEKKMKIKRAVPAEGVTFKTCDTCGGQGQVTRVQNTILGQMRTAAVCPTCQGSGKKVDQRPAGVGPDGLEKVEEVVSIRIPAGVQDGMQLRVAGKGNMAPGGGAAGDLIVAIEEEEHDVLKRDGQTLHYELFLSLPDAALGASVEVPTLQGKARVKIDAGTQSGKVLRLKGKGLPSVDSYGTGDLLIHLQVWTPKNLSNEEKSVLESWRESKNFAPTPSASDKGFFDRIRDMF
jgi:molecular chaperone DnaJ